MSLIKNSQQVEISEQRRMPVDNVATDSLTSVSESVTFQYYNSGVLTTDAGQIAGVAIVAKLTNRNIKNALGDVVGQFNDTSVALTTGTTFTTLVRFPYKTAELKDTDTGTLKLDAILATFNDGAGAEDGDYCIDHRTGTIYGQKADTGTSDTFTYKVETGVSGGSSVLPSSVDVAKLAGVALVADNAASPATDYPLPTGGQYNSSLPTYTDGDRTMAQFDVNGKLIVASAASSTALQALGTDATGADAYATVLTSGAVASHISIDLKGSNDAIVSVDGGTTDGIYVVAGSSKSLDGITIGAAADIQAKNASAGNNYTGLSISIW